MSEFSSRNFADLYIVFILVWHLLFLSMLSIFRLKFCSTCQYVGVPLKPPPQGSLGYSCGDGEPNARNEGRVCLCCPASVQDGSSHLAFPPGPGNVPKAALLCDGWAELGFHPQLYQPAKL